MELDVLIEIVKLRFSYKSKRQFFNLKVDDLLIYKNQVTSILGRSGLGKSSLLDIIGLIKEPSDIEHAAINYHFGDSKKLTSLWGDKTQLNKIKRNKIGYIFQQPFFLNDISIENNAYLQTIIRNIPEKERSKAIKESFLESPLFDETERDNFRIKKDDGDPLLTSNISGGQRQRFSILRATFPGTEVIFADEPTGNLDPINAEKVFEHLKEWVHESGQERSLIMVTHDLDAAIQYSDNIVIIDFENEIKPRNRFQKQTNKLWINGLNENVHLNKELITNILKKGTYTNG